MIEKLKRCLIVLFLLLSAFCLLPTVLTAQQPTSTAPLFVANSQYLQGRTWADYKASAGAGLVLNIAAGTAYCGNPPVPVFYAGGTLTLTASQTNYVYLNPAAMCAPAFNIAGFAVSQIPLAKVVTGASAISSVTDVRSWFTPSACTMDSAGRVICRPLNAGKNIAMRGQFYSFKKANAVARNYITGTAWTIRTSAADNDWHGIAWSPELGLFAAVADTGTGNRVMTSPDGINWTIRTSAADNNWYAIAWSPELRLFAAVAYTGTGNRVMTSPDGINWTSRTSAADNSWMAIAWSPELGLFAAVASSGTGNRVMTSPDGINWTIQTSAADNSWRAIAWSPELGLFAAVAYSGTGNRVMTSPDGINWTIRTSAADNDWLGIAWSPELGLFAAVANTGSGNRVMTSPDGINWTIRTSAADNGWYGIAWSPELGLFAAVAYSGTGNRVMTWYCNRVF